MNWLDRMGSKQIIVTMLYILYVSSSYAASEAAKVISETNVRGGDSPYVREGDATYLKRKFDDGTSDLVQVMDQLRVREGLLRVIRKRDDEAEVWEETAGTVLLNGSEVFLSETSNVSLDSSYYVGGKTYVLIGETCGGTGCRYAELSFLALNGEQPATVITVGDFFSEIDSIKGTIQDSTIVIDLGISKQSKKMATLKDNKVAISYEKLPYKPLSIQKCSELYKLARDCTELFQKYKLACNQYAIDYTPGYNSGMWAMRYIKNEPGFDQKSFDRECLSACEIGKLENEDLFKKNVCGIK